MNLTSVVVGSALMASLAPAVANMSIQPFIAAKRSENFGIAETAAVVYAARYEGTLDIPENTETCTVAAREETENAYSVTCTHGSGDYVQSVTRAFRLAVPDSELNNGDGVADGRIFQFETPTRFSGHSCPITDPWGVYGYNDRHYDLFGGACKPLDVWSQTAYQFSNPDAWLYDVNNFNGWGSHPDY